MYRPQQDSDSESSNRYNRAYYLFFLVIGAVIGVGAMSLIVSNEWEASDGSPRYIDSERVVTREVEVPVEVVHEVEVIRNVEVPVDVVREIVVTRDVEVPIEVVQEIEVIRNVEVPVEVTREIEVSVEVIREVEIVREIEVEVTRVVVVTPTSTATPRPPSTAAELVERVKPGIVGITAQRASSFLGIPTTKSQLGSGAIFRIEETTAFVVTNFHVVENADDVVVRLHDGQEYEGLVLGWDADKDVVLLSICCSMDYESLAWSAIEPTIGSDVVAVGYAGDDPQLVATTGVVLEADDFSAQHGFVAHSAPLNPGNSGGPVFSMSSAEIVGVNTARSTQALVFYAVPHRSVEAQIEDWASQLVVLPAPTPTHTPTPAHVIPLGTVRGQDFAYTLHEIRDPAKHKEEWHEPEEGYRLVGFEMTLEALRDGADFDTWGVKVEDTEGYVYHWELGTFQVQPSLRVVKDGLTANQKTRGWITFEVPSSAVLSAILLPEHSDGIVVLGTRDRVTAGGLTTPTHTPTPIPFGTVQGKAFSHTVNEIRDPAQPLRGKVNTGNRLVAIDVSLVALVDDAYYNPFRFSLQDEDGYIWVWDDRIRPDIEPGLGSGELSSGQKARGWMAFEVPQSAVLTGVFFEELRSSTRVMIADLTGD